MRQIGIILVLSILLVHATRVLAAWPENGLLLSGAAAQAVTYGVASDGAGGCIIVWHDDRDGGSELYAQRVDGSGNPLWAPEGVPVCVQPGIQFQASIVADDAGGAFIVWEDQRTGDSDIYAQRVQSNGTMAWQVNGKPVCIAADDQTSPVVSGGGSHILVTWTDNRIFPGTLSDIYAQRLDGNGDPVWTVDGVTVCAAAGNQTGPTIVSDGGAGAIIAWEDARTAINDIYVNHVNIFGTPDWGSTGTKITWFSDNKERITMVSDGQAGAIIAWVMASAPGIEVVRVGPDGSYAWPVRVKATDEPLVGGLHSVTDGSGGMILAWTDQRNGLDGDPYVQRITAAGARMWWDGVSVAVGASEQYPGTLVADGEGGAVVLFHDNRRDPQKSDLYAQRMAANGLAQWPADGVAVIAGPSSVSNSAFVHGVLTSDGSLMIEFNAFTGSNFAYAQRVELVHGWWGKPEPSVLSVADNPGDQGGQVLVSWSASERDNPTQQQITHYSLWRATESAPSSNAVTDAVALIAGAERRMVTLEDIGPGFSGKAVRKGAFMGTTHLWEFVTTQQAIFTPGYSDLVATRQDSVGSDPAQHYFQVVAHTADSQVFFPSAPDSGASVDNLAPAAPLSLIAARTGGANVDLDWSPSGAGEADFKEYWIYRGTSTGFPTDPAHFLGSTPDTMATDPGATTNNAWFYKVVAVDIHDNPSDDSNEASVSATPTGIGERSPALTALTVQNYPNPFGMSTEVRIGLPAASRVTMEVYDVAGKRVTSRDLGSMEAGFQSMTFSGRDESGRLLSSGVYFCRIAAGQWTATRKMVIHR